MLGQITPVLELDILSGARTLTFTPVTFITTCILNTLTHRATVSLGKGPRGEKGGGVAQRRQREQC